MFKWIIGGVVAVLALWSITTINGLARSNQEVSASYAQVQNVLQRQAELIPNLVETVKGYAKFEQDTFTQVANARAKAGGVTNIDASKIAGDPESQKKFQEATNEMQSSLSRLLVVSEKYPELKADKGFQDLRTEITGSINRVTTERRKNQMTVKDYNTRLVVFPGSIVGRAAGYAEKPYFEADATSQRAPTVKF